MKIWNQIFDKILVLSLKESEDRREHIRKEFQRVGIEDYEFFDATHYSSQELIDIKKTDKVYLGPLCFRCGQKRCACENNYLTDFQIANWLSFIRMWKYIIDQNYKFVLICEDDIVFTPQHQRIIFPLLQKNSLRAYRVRFELPLLIGMGGAYHPHKHLSNEMSNLKRQNVMCNPCFCLNQQMAKLFYEKYHIHHTSDHFMHIEIPKRFPFVQHLMMYPWPVYELSFVPGMIKFKSLVRPKGQTRRKVYQDFLIISPVQSLQTTFMTKLLHFLQIPSQVNYQVKKVDQTYRNYYGCLNEYFLMNEEDQQKYMFLHIYLFTFGEEKDKEMIEKEWNQQSFYEMVCKKYQIQKEDYYTFVHTYVKERFPNILIVDLSSFESCQKYLKLLTMTLQRNKNIEKLYGQLTN